MIFVKTSKKTHVCFHTNQFTHRVRSACDKYLCKKAFPRPSVNHFMGTLTSQEEFATNPCKACLKTVQRAATLTRKQLAVYESILHEHHFET